MARIAFAGFHHETNTFSPTPATWEDFAQADGWPPLCTGQEMLRHVQGMNLPITGMVEAASEWGHTVLPILWCSAQPSGPVTREAYERIVAMVMEGLVAAQPLDAIVLDLHGAMVCEHLSDGEGELLARLRHTFGREIPLFIALDFHANISPRMVEHASWMRTYRTYPHVDMAATGRAVMEALHRYLSAPFHIAKAHLPLPFLIPIPAQCTLAEPALGLSDICGRLEATMQPPASLSLAYGFPLADTPFTGPCVLAYGREGDGVSHAAATLYAAVCAAESQFSLALLSPSAAVARAQELSGNGPVILVDTQDNPGAGGTSATTGLLQALLEADAQNAVFGLVCDPAATALAHQAGENAIITCGIGATPIHGEYTVLRLTDGAFTATGPMYAGSRMQLGPMAVLKRGGVRIVLSSKKQQLADRSMLRHVGIEPESCAIIALKSSVHFRADFQAIAHTILLVEAPGANIADLRKLEYRNLPATVRPMPGK